MIRRFSLPILVIVASLRLAVVGLFVILLAWPSVTVAQTGTGCCVNASTGTCQEDVQASSCTGSFQFLQGVKCRSVPACRIQGIISPTSAQPLDTGIKESVTPSTPLTLTPNVPIPGLFEGPQKVDETLLGRYISNFYIFFAGVAGILAIVVMMWGGFHYITSAGNAQKMRQGKEIITNAMMGLVLVFTSYLLLRTINPSLVRLSLPRVDYLRQTLQPGYYCESNGVAKAEAATQNATCGQVVKYSDSSGQQHECVSLAVTLAERNADVACIPYLDGTTIQYARVSADQACENNTYTADDKCFQTQSIFALQDWLKGGCAKGDIIQTLSTGHDVCHYFPFLNCPVGDSVRVACNIGGVSETDCWKNNGPRKADTGYLAIRAICRSPETKPLPIEYVDGVCCQATAKSDIKCYSHGTSLDIQVDCTRTNNLPGTYQGSNVVTCDLPNRCWADLRMLFKNQTYLLE